MNDYNETVKKIQSLFETPYVMSGDVKFIEDLGGGVVLAHRAINEGKLIAEISYRGSNLKCYEIINNFIYNIWVENELTRCYFLFKREGNGIIEKSIEQGVSITGLARYLYLNYYLKKYQFIISDSVHTEKGKRFWIKLAAELPEGFQLSVITNKNETVIDPKDVADTFSRDIKVFSRIKVSKTPTSTGLGLKSHKV